MRGWNPIYAESAYGTKPDALRHLKETQEVLSLNPSMIRSTEKVKLAEKLVSK
jgi:hypothetical protein